MWSQASATSQSACEAGVIYTLYFFFGISYYAIDAPQPDIEPFQRPWGLLWRIVFGLLVISVQLEEA